MPIDRLVQGVALVFVGSGAVGAAKVASYLDQPYVAFGYLVGASIFLISGVVRLIRAL